MRAYKLTKAPVIDDALKEDIIALVTACQKNGDDGVPYPLDEEDCFHYLLWSGEDVHDGSGQFQYTHLTGALAILPLSGETAECIAYVRPDHRMEGCFSHILLPEASEDFSDLTFVFPVRGKDPADGIHPAISSAVRKTLSSIGAGYDCTEYMMELLLKASPDSLDDESRGKGSGGTCDTPLPEEFSLCGDEGEPIASCRFERVSADTVCLYAVEVKPERRDEGFGTRLLGSVKELLKKCGISRVIVHVSASNLPAVSLYEKAGFRTTETLSFYTF